MPEKSEILRLVRIQYDEIDRFIAGMSATERANSGTVDNWMPRNILMHIFAWQQHNAEKLAAVRTGQEPPKDTDAIDDANARIFAQHVDDTWDEISAAITSVKHKYLQEVEALSQADINSTTYIPWATGRPLWQEVLGDGFIHPISHLGQAYIDRGDLAEAERLRLREAELLSALDADPRWQANISYNLVCHYALTGAKEKALGYLEPSFEKRPQLVDWSQQDADLRSLHNDPDFQALVKRYQ